MGGPWVDERGPAIRFAGGTPLARLGLAFAPVPSGPCLFLQVWSSTVTVSI